MSSRSEEPTNDQPVNVRSIESLSRDEDREYGGQEVEPADEGENPAGVFLLVVETVEQILRRVGLLDASKD